MAIARAIDPVKLRQPKLFSFIVEELARTLLWRAGSSEPSGSGRISPRMPHQASWLSAWLACSLAGAGLPGLARQEPAPNFVLIVADDLGYGDLSTYDGWVPVPHLDRLAAQGLRFTDFHSNGPVCSPTRAAFLTGRYQQRAGIAGVLYADPQRPEHADGLQASELTFARLLKQAGYVTGIMGKWHLGYEPQYNPVHHGFDEFHGYLSGNIDYFSHVDQAGALDWWHNLEPLEEPGYSTHLITRHAVDFIRRHARERFCLVVAHEAPHAPYQAPYDDPRGFRIPGQARASQRLSPVEIRTRYRDMVIELDRSIGEVIRVLEELKLAERTLVFFFSDNGATPEGSNKPLRAHKGSLFEGGHRVPAIAWWPGQISPGRTTDQLAAGFDLMPTMLELAGVSLPAKHRLDGISLVPVLFRGEPLPARRIFWGYQGRVAMRDGPWKYVRGEAELDGQPGLFRLDQDVSERENLASRYPARVKSMEAATREWLEEMRRTATPQPSSRNSR